MIIASVIMTIIEYTQIDEKLRMEKLSVFSIQYLGTRLNK